MQVPHPKLCPALAEIQLDLSHPIHCPHGQSQWDALPVGSPQIWGVWGICSSPSTLVAPLPAPSGLGAPPAPSPHPPPASFQPGFPQTHGPVMRGQFWSQTHPWAAQGLGDRWEPPQFPDPTPARLPGTGCAPHPVFCRQQEGRTLFVGLGFFLLPFPGGEEWSMLESRGWM